MAGWYNAHSDLEGIDLGDDRDEFEDDGPSPEEECGRWRNGKLAPVNDCLSAGSEFCQIECPMRGGK